MNSKPTPTTLINTPDTALLNPSIHRAAVKAGRWLAGNGYTLSTAESCTGGGIAFAVTQVPGSSAWFDRGFVTYSNLAKQQMVSVDHDLIETYGAVSEQVAAAMAQGGLANSTATISLSVTGIAGPDGGSQEKPVGTVCFGRAQGSAVLTTTKLFRGDRDAVRYQSILYALEEWLAAMT